MASPSVRSTSLLSMSLVGGALTPAYNSLSRHARVCLSARTFRRDPERKSFHMSQVQLLDLDALLDKNRYGGEGKSQPSLDEILATKRYGGQESGSQHALEEIDLAPEYPHDLDVGPLFCVKANRCFLDGGKRCGKYQEGNRNKGMLQDLYQACKETGFFFMHNTMVEDHTLQTMYAHTRQFHIHPHQQNLREQLRVEDTGCTTPGWVPLKEHPAYTSGILANSTAFNLPNVHTPRIWPTTELVDESFQRDVSEYYEQMDYMSHRLAYGFAKMLDIPPEHFEQIRTDQSLSNLQLISYPPKKPERDVEGVKPGSQTDGVLFSIINQSCPGLQVKDAKGTWCNVRCSTERFIVLIGDALEHITNGELKATKHRNVCVEHDRMMLTFRAGLDADAVIEPHELYASDPIPKKYKPRTQKEHADIRKKQRLE